MKVIYQVPIHAQIRKAIYHADDTGRQIARIELPSKEMIELERFASSFGVFSHSSNPRSIRFMGVSVVEVLEKT